MSDLLIKYGKLKVTATPTPGANQGRVLFRRGKGRDVLEEAEGALVWSGAGLGDVHESPHSWSTGLVRRHANNSHPALSYLLVCLSLRLRPASCRRIHKASNSC